MLWDGLKAEVLSLKHLPIKYLEMRHECRTFRSVVSDPCDRLFLVLAMRAQGVSLTNKITDCEIDEWDTITVQHIIAW